MRRPQQRSWSELTTRQRTLVVAGTAVEVALTTWAASDLKDRDASGVRGPKALWAAVLLVQPFGPVAYLVLGRR